MSKVMFGCNFWALIYLFIGLVATEGLGGFQYCFSVENHVLGIYIILFSLCSAIGQNFIFYTLASFGSMPLATITTTRKFFTILVSVLLFGHVLKAQQWMGVVMVFAGLGIELYCKYQKNEAKKRAALRDETKTK